MGPCSPTTYAARSPTPSGTPRSSARRSRRCATTWPDIDVVDAYEIQLLNIRRRLEAGARVNGHKVGLSSKAMQEMMGVDEPDYGHLLSDMEVSRSRRAGADASRYCYPRVEVEVGLRPRRDAAGRGLHRGRRHPAPREYVAPGDRADRQPRSLDWDIGIADTIADNASSAGYVLGPERVRPEDVDLKAIDARC